ncbi:hypothetical protein [uncultured Anaerococcus sp.]|nr:hypothetical protein [uncultured Anaerococcus sp.]
MNIKDIKKESLNPDQGLRMKLTEESEKWLELEEKKSIGKDKI